MKEMNEYNQKGRTSGADEPGRREERAELDKAKNAQRNAAENEENDEFPGYPHYPASEDIMNPANHMERVPVDVEKLAPTESFMNQQPPKESASAREENTVMTALNQPDDDLKIVSGTEADLTREDLRVLKAIDSSFAPPAASVTGDDLDVPGADLDDPNEDIGEEDEENNYYSLGGDNHDNLEEDPS